MKSSSQGSLYTRPGWGHGEEKAQMPLEKRMSTCDRHSHSLQEAWVQNPHGLLGTLTKGLSEPHHLRPPAGVTPPSPGGCYGDDPGLGSQ